MITPYSVSAVFVLAVMALCFLKPGAGRIFMGIFFLVMAFGVNGAFILTDPQAYVEYGSGALLPIYRQLTLQVIALSPLVFGLLLFTFEVTVALLVLYKGKSVKVGLLGMLIFIVALTPLSTLQFIYLGLAVALAYLLTKNYDTSLWDMLFARRRHSRTS